MSNNAFDAHYRYLYLPTLNMRLPFRYYGHWSGNWLGDFVALEFSSSELYYFLNLSSALEVLRQDGFFVIGDHNLLVHKDTYSKFTTKEDDHWGKYDEPKIFSIKNPPDYFKKLRVGLDEFENLLYKIFGYDIINYSFQDKGSLILGCQVNFPALRSDDGVLLERFLIQDPIERLHSLVTESLCFRNLVYSTLCKYFDVHIGLTKEYVDIEEDSIPLTLILNNYIYLENFSLELIMTFYDKVRRYYNSIGEEMPNAIRVNCESRINELQNGLTENN